jgi:signal transduction histidine kinase
MGTSGKFQVRQHWIEAIALLAAILVFFPLAADAQLSRNNRAHASRDSMVALLRSSTLPDTARAKTLYNLSWEFRQSDLASARRYGEEGLKLSRKINYCRGELNCLAELSSIAISSQEYLRAEQLAQELVRRAAQAPPNLVRYRAKGLETIAMVATAQEQPARAALYYRQQLGVALAHQPELSNMLPMAYLGLAGAYYTQQQLGNTADSVGMLCRRYARTARQLAHQQKEPLVEAASLQMLALAFETNNRLDSANALMRKALQLYRANNATYNEASALLVLADYAVQRNQLTEATDLAQQARRLAHNVQDPASELNAYEILADVLAQQGQGMPAYRAIRAAKQIADSLQKADNAQTLSELQVKFDTERKESHIRALTQQQRLNEEQVARQRQRLWALGAILLAVAIGLAVTWMLAARLRRSRTELATRNDELEHSRAAQDRLYAIVAHELRGPLAALHSLAPTLRYYRDQNDAVALDEIADEVGQTADHLTRLLDNLLHYAASQAGELRYRPEALAAASVLSEVTTLYAAAARARQVRLVMDIAPDVAVWTDRAMLMTVFRNLTHNALKVSSAGTSITLQAVMLPDNRCRLTVTDQGPGLAPDRIAELLGLAGPPLGSRPAAGPERGTGLGLPLVRQLVTQQAGTFTLTSIVGQGTTAIVELPSAEILVEMV